MLTEQELTAIEERAEKATAGPWTIECRSILNDANDPSWPEDDFLQFHLRGPAPVTGRGDYNGRDADFMAQARTDVPALVAEVRRQRAILTHVSIGAVPLDMAALGFVRTECGVSCPCSCCEAGR